jgi:hypothetical protein
MLITAVVSLQQTSFAPDFVMRNFVRRNIGGGGLRVHLSAPMIFGLLAATTAIVAALSLFAKHGLSLALLAVAPIVFLNMPFLLDLIAPDELLFDAARRDQAAADVSAARQGPGSLARAILNHRSVAVETAPH